MSAEPYMSQQPLAFTLVKTVVTARDEGERLAPAYRTAWSMVSAELDEPTRQLLDDLHWGPQHQLELRRVIDGVRRALSDDPALESEFSTFLAEHQSLVESLPEPSGELMLDSHAESTTSRPDLHDTVRAEGIHFVHQDQQQAEELAHPPDVSVEPAGADVPPTTTAAVEAEVGAGQTVDSTTDDSTLDSPTPQLPQRPIPMIVLEPELWAELDEEEADEADLPAASAPEYAAPPAVVAEAPLAAVEPSLEARLVEQARVSKDMPRAEVPPPAIPIFPDATQRSAPLAKRSPQPAVKASLITLLALLLLGLLVYGLYRLLRPAPTAELVTAPVAEQVAPADEPLSALPATLQPLLAVEAVSLSEAGDVAGARQVQQAYVEQLKVDNANTTTLASAMLSLAALTDAAGKPLAAVDIQKQSLALAKSAFGESSEAAGEAHLALAGYYLHANQEHMARAHLLQARFILDKSTSVQNPTRRANLQQLLDQLKVD